MEGKSFAANREIPAWKPLLLYLLSSSKCLMALFTWKRVFSLSPVSGRKRNILPYSPRMVNVCNGKHVYHERHSPTSPPYLWKENVSDKGVASGGPRVRCILISKPCPTCNCKKDLHCILLVLCTFQRSGNLVENGTFLCTRVLVVGIFVYHRLISHITKHLCYFLPKACPSHEAVRQGESIFGRLSWCLEMDNSSNRLCGKNFLKRWVDTCEMIQTLQWASLKPTQVLTLAFDVWKRFSWPFPIILATDWLIQCGSTFSRKSPYQACKIINKTTTRCALRRSIEWHQNQGVVSFV